SGSIVAKRSSRKRRERSGRAGRAAAPAASAAGSAPGGEAGPADVQAPAGGAAREGANEGGGTTGAGRGYARSRAKDEQARAALKPLRRGERPRAVTVGAVVAGLMALINLVALVVSYESDEPGKALSTIAGTGLLLLVAVGMWRSRYTAVLGMQTLLAIAIIIASLDLLGTTSARNALLAVAVIAASGTLFWHLVKAMARIQMPARPGSKPR
ncbi:MAG TPA: hypothetical protein VEQ61_08840, partial [Thermoleophilaceae bacterium]|nr:hypothetical protein [Thermoleophilaceae bacterium]